MALKIPAASDTLRKETRADVSTRKDEKATHTGLVNSAAKFDRVTYQREYMRVYRKRQKEKRNVG